MNRQTKESLQTKCRHNSPQSTAGPEYVFSLLNLRKNPGATQPQWAVKASLPACSFQNAASPACVPIDACPRLGFVRAQTLSLLREFAHAETPEHRAQVQHSAAALAHMIEQVIQPLFARLHGPAWKAECRAMFESLCVIVRCDPKLHPANFAADDDRWQLVCDRLDSLEVLMRHVLARRNHKAGQAGETEVA